MTYNAIISPCGKFRYLLTRIVAETGPLVCVVMVNPSKADGTLTDHTIRKLDGFAKRLGWRGYIVVNKFAYRATDVNELKAAIDPIGPLCGGYIAQAMIQCDFIVVAWGSLVKLPLTLRSRWRLIVNHAQALKRDLYCWQTCNDGHPVHPVMIGYENQLKIWRAPT